MRHRGLRIANRGTARKGMAVVEMAIVFPVLFFFTIGVVEAGRLLHLKQMVDAANREGARQASTGTLTSSKEHAASLPFNGDEEVQQAVINYLKNANIPTTGMTVTVTNVTQSLTATLTAPTTSGAKPSADPTGSANQGDVLEIAITYPYGAAKWSPLNRFIPSGTIINAKRRWKCLRDKPMSVVTDIPDRPL